MLSKLGSFLTTYRFEIAITLLIIGLRIPSFFEPHWYGDENIYLTIGQALRSGLKLYSDIFDHKPPLLYWLTGVLGSLPALKLCLAAGTAAAGVFLSLLTRRLFPGRWVRWVTVGIFITLTTLPSFEGDIFNAELLFLPLTTGGMYFGYRAIEALAHHGPASQRTSKALLLVSGACFGLAALVKVPAGFDLAALWLTGVLALSGKRAFPWQRLKRFTVPLIAGSVVPLAVLLLYLSSQGTLNDFITYGVLYNFRYIQDWSTVAQSSVLSFLAPWPLRIGIMLAALLTAGITQSVRSSPRFQLAYNWFWFSLFGALLSLRPYPHYFVQVLPSLALLAGATVSIRSGFARIAGSISIISFVLLITYVPVKLYRTQGYYRNFFDYVTHQSDYESYTRWFNQSVPDLYALASWFTGRSGASDTLFVWGNEPALYYLTRLRPVTRFVTDYHVLSFDGFGEVAAELTAVPATFITDCRRDPASFPALYRLLADRYTRVHQTAACDIYREYSPTQVLQ